jgi:hypothetical protein
MCEIINNDKLHVSKIVSKSNFYYRKKKLIQKIIDMQTWYHVIE